METAEDNTDIEKALRASEARFRAMNDASPLGVFVTDKNGDCTYTNQAYQKIVGYSFDELLGQGWSKAIHPEDRDAIFKQWYESTLKKPFHFQSEYRNLRPDGRTIYLSVKAAEMNDGTTAYGYVGTIEDISEFKQARIKLEESEQKYRHLVEDSSDIIFSLDDTGRFLTVSRAVHEHLNHSPAQLIGKPFLDLIYFSTGRIVDYGAVADHLQTALGTDRAVDFTADFSTRQQEPYELKVRLERMRLEEGLILYGKASRMSEDILLKHCRAEKQEYEIGNNLTLAETLARRLTARLAFQLNEMELMGMKLGVREILVNAIEHGNLQITFEEKSAAMETGELRDLIRQRVRDPGFANKKVRVAYTLTEDYVEFDIADEGPGFDHAKMKNADIKSPERALLLHGRGIALARDAFDAIEYNSRGNQVRLRKNFAS